MALQLTLYRPERDALLSLLQQRDIPPTLAHLAARLAASAAQDHPCAICGVTVSGHARTCSDRCRQALARQKRGVGVDAIAGGGLVQHSAAVPQVVVSDNLTPPAPAVAPHPPAAAANTLADAVTDAVAEHGSSWPRGLAAAIARQYNVSPQAVAQRRQKAIAALG